MVNEASWIVLLRLRHPRNPNEAAGASLVTITRAIGDVGALDARLPAKGVPKRWKGWVLKEPNIYN